jgi:hypothetical protein
VDNGKWIVDGRNRMLQYALFSILSFSSFNVRAQVPHIDDSIFTAKIKQAKAEKLDTLPIGERVAAMGKLFLGTPYVAGTLDVDSNVEWLTVDLHSFDCVTFYENAWALARLIRSSWDPTPSEYIHELTFLRYRNGQFGLYHSRLHYTIDYFFDNENKRFLQNMTPDIGGQYVKRDERVINFMTAHRGSYKQLAHDNTEYAAMLKVEKNINARKGFDYIPKEDVAKVESKIATGDILGITTNIAGLDCSHTGIAIRMPDGRIHFMHASSLMGKVIISDEPLAEYLTHSSHQTGIIVMRPIEVPLHKLFKG